MYSLLLRKALPFALTFILGSLVGGLFKAVGIGGGASNARSYFYGYGDGHGHSCRMRYKRRYLVAESKPLLITFKPDARLPVDLKPTDAVSERDLPALVTFGADGRVQKVARPEARVLGEGLYPFDEWWQAVESAAWQIKFEPETVNGVPVTVTREVEIRFMTSY